MVRLKAFWQGFINVAVLFSFIMNFIFLVVVVVLVLLIFDLKRGLVQPLVDGLHSSFVGLDEATIITTIKVDDTVPVKLNIPLQTNTTVVLTDNVPVRANATFNLPGGGGTINGAVSIVLPLGLRLPVSLNLTVPVNDTLPIHLSVPVNIKISGTELHDAIAQLRDLLDPYVRLLGNLPNSWGEFPGFIGNIISGTQPSLLRPNQQSLHPWNGFRTGVGTPIPTVPGALTTPLPTSASDLSGGSSTGNPTAVSPINPPDQSGGSSGNSNPPATAAPFMTPTRSSDLGIITPVPH